MTKDSTAARAVRILVITAFVAHTCGAALRGRSLQWGEISPQQSVDTNAWNSGWAGGWDSTSGSASVSSQAPSEATPTPRPTPGNIWNAFPSAPDKGPVSHSLSTPGTVIPLSGGNDGSATNLQRCTGECDSDSQCAAGLKCFQRSNGEAIPGCSGTGHAPDWGYCYDPNFVPAPAPTAPLDVDSGLPYGCQGRGPCAKAEIAQFMPVQKALTRYTCESLVSGCVRGDTHRVPGGCAGTQSLRNVAQCSTQWNQAEGEFCAGRDEFCAEGLECATPPPGWRFSTCRNIRDYEPHQSRYCQARGSAHCGEGKRCAGSWDDATCELIPGWKPVVAPKMTTYSCSDRVDGCVQDENCYGTGEPARVIYQTHRLIWFQYVPVVEKIGRKTCADFWHQGEGHFCNGRDDFCADGLRCVSPMGNVGNSTCQRELTTPKGPPLPAVVPNDWGRNSSPTPAPPLGRGACTLSPSGRQITAPNGDSVRVGPGDDGDDDRARWNLQASGRGSHTIALHHRQHRHHGGGAATCPKAPSDGQCRIVPLVFPPVRICANAARVITWKKTDRRPTFQSSGFPTADAAYVCKGYATGGHGAHQAKQSIKSWSAATPESATRDNVYTPTGHTYNVYWDCTRCDHTPTEHAATLPGRDVLSTTVRDTFGMRITSGDGPRDVSKCQPGMLFAECVESVLACDGISTRSAT